jgi:phage terminase large subunit
MEINFSPSLKQDLIFEYFNDKITTEVLYGGAAAGGKSYGMCALMILQCLQHPTIRVGLARNELTTLKKTTVVSLFEVINDWGLKIDEHYRYNSTSGEITFTNGSKIVLLELKLSP